MSRPFIYPADTPEQDAADRAYFAECERRAAQDRAPDAGVVEPVEDEDPMPDYDGAA